jgi:hypothetical protein
MNVSIHNYGLSESFKLALSRLTSKGGFNEDLDLVIREHQKARGGTQDGFISVAKASVANKGKYDKKSDWIIYALNKNIVQFVRSLYPRIDLASESGEEISKTIRAAFLPDV